MKATWKKQHPARPKYKIPQAIFGGALRGQIKCDYVQMMLRGTGDNAR